jgi:hypothetical protein
MMRGAKAVPLGGDATDDLLERALAVFRSGKRVGTAGLARELDVELRDAIAAIGELRSQGKIRNYDQQTYTAI